MVGANGWDGHGRTQWWVLGSLEYGMGVGVGAGSVSVRYARESRSKRWGDWRDVVAMLEEMRR